MADFAESYRAGRTPNPCIVCNRRVKFAQMLSAADALGCAQIATGHYARVEFDGAGLLTISCQIQTIYGALAIQRRNANV